MSVTPLINYASAGKSLWLRNNPDLIVSSITVNQQILVDSPSGAVFQAAEANPSSMVVRVDAPAVPGAGSFISLASTGPPTQKELTISVLNDVPDASIGYAVEGNPVGFIDFVSSFRGSTGGVRVVGQDGTALEVGVDAVATMGSAGGVLVQNVNNNYAVIGYFTGMSPSFTQQSAIIWNSNDKAVSLSSGAAGSGGPYLQVNQNETILSPGSNQPVTLLNGYMNLNSNALSNVSSINGRQFPTSFLPITWSSNFSIGNQGDITPGAPVLIASVDVEAGQTYRISMNPTFNSSGAPGATDYLAVYGSSGIGPDDTIDFITLNLNWAGNGLNPGLAGAYGQGVCGIMTAQTTPYNIYGSLSVGTTVNTNIQFGNGNPIVVEHL